MFSESNVTIPIYGHLNIAIRTCDLQNYSFINTVCYSKGLKLHCYRNGLLRCHVYTSIFWSIMDSETYFLHLRKSKTYLIEEV